MSHWKDQLATKRRARHTPSYRSPRRSTRTVLWAKYAKIAFILSIVGVVGLMLFIPILSLTLPSPDKIVRREGFSTKILDRNGEVLYDIFVDQRRTQVPISQIPDYVKQGTIAVEDQNFYSHQGFDPTAYIRILFDAVFKRRIRGGSTLTQQLVKNVLLSPETTIWRKVKELVLALQIESRYSKDQILELYLNEVPYGGTAYGVEAAAEVYFGKKVTDLNLTESAILAGLPQSPSRYSPYSSTPKAFIARTKHVLQRMREDGYITEEQEKASSEEIENITFVGKGASFKAPHFVQYVQEILEERYGQSAVEQGGLKVTTTLDLKLQDQAQTIVSEEIEKVEKLKIGNGAAVVLDPETGEILAMVGSKNFNAEDYDGQVNVTMSLRQPGSSIKPITYVTAFKKGFTPATLLVDTPTKFPGGADNPDYEPVNYDGKFRGPVQVRYALANSLNVPAVKMLALTGIKDVLSTAYDLGLTSLEPTKETLSRVGLSLTLGGGEVRLLELTGAYGAFMNGGYKLEPVAILRVEDSNGRILEEVKPEKGKQVLTTEQAFLIADILSDNTARAETFGTNSLLNVPGWDIAAKTGTTNDKRDNWALGGNQHVAVGVWVGNNDNSPMQQVASGVSGASPIWRKILMAALEGKPKVTFDPPKDIQTVQVDAISGYREHDGFPARSEYFVKGTEPGEDTVHVKLKVCKNEGKLATPSDVVAGNYDEKEYIVLKEEDPTAGAGSPNRWQEGILSWIDTQTDSRYKPPTEYCNGVNSAPLNVEFTSPRDRDSNLPNQFTVKFRIDTINSIDLAELEIDGTRVRSFTGGPFEYEVNLSNGTHTLRAIAHDSKGNQSDRVITIGVNTSWDSN